MSGNSPEKNRGGQHEVIYIGPNPVLTAKLAMVRDVREGLSPLLPPELVDKLDHGDFTEADLPPYLEPPENAISFAFRLRRDTGNRLWIITFPKTQEGETDFTKAPRTRMETLESKGREQDTLLN